MLGPLEAGFNDQAPLQSDYMVVNVGKLSISVEIMIFISLGARISVAILTMKKPQGGVVFKVLKE